MMGNLLKKPLSTLAVMWGEDRAVGQSEAESSTGLAQNQVCLYTELHGGHVTVHFWFLLGSSYCVSLTLSVH